MNTKLKHIFIIVILAMMLLTGYMTVAESAESQPQITRTAQHRFRELKEKKPGLEQKEYSPLPGYHNLPDNESYNTYIDSVLPKYLTDRIYEYSNIQISQAYKVNGNPDNNSRAYFITAERKCIGLLFVTYLDGVFHSSYGFEDSAIITDAIENSVPFSLFTLRIGTLFVQTEQGNYLLSPFENPEDLPKHFQAELEKIYQKSKIILYDICSLSTGEIKIQGNKNSISYSHPWLYP